MGMTGLGRSFKAKPLNFDPVQRAGSDHQCGGLWVCYSSLFMECRCPTKRIRVGNTLQGFKNRDDYYIGDEYRDDGLYRPSLTGMTLKV